MTQIGIDIGSTYTKYCIRTEDKKLECFSEKTPVRQKEYFDRKLADLRNLYPEAKVVSCGYGRHNIDSVKNISELIALAAGVEFESVGSRVILDIGGQDTKIIVQEQGKLKEFFVNDKCAAGCGMFLSNTLNMLQMKFEDINLIGIDEPECKLSSTCAVFAQTEIVELIARNKSPESIIQGVIWQIMTQSSALLRKVSCNEIVLSGGLTQIPGILGFAERIFKKKAAIPDRAIYMSAIGCSLL